MSIELASRRPGGRFISSADCNYDFSILVEYLAWQRPSQRLTGQVSYGLFPAPAIHTVMLNFKACEMRIKTMTKARL